MLWEEHRGDRKLVQVCVPHRGNPCANAVPTHSLSLVLSRNVRNTLDLRCIILQLDRGMDSLYSGEWHQTLTCAMMNRG